MAKGTLHKFTQIAYYSILAFITLFIAYLAIMLAISPKKDADDRGFIGCTKQLVADIGMCEKGSILCVLGVIWDDTVCNTKIVSFGFAEWIKGKQEYPWDNYLYTPKYEISEDLSGSYYDDNLSDMAELQKQNDFMQRGHDELDAAKQRVYNLNSEVLASDYEGEDADGAAFNKQLNDNEGVSSPQDIAEEANIDGYKDKEGK